MNKSQGQIFLEEGRKIRSIDNGADQIVYLTSDAVPDYYVSSREDFLHPVYEIGEERARLVGSTSGTADWLTWERNGRAIPAHMIRLAATDADAALIEGATFYASRK